MKELRRTISTLVILFIVSGLYAQDFRKVSWGMSMREVQRLETADKSDLFNATKKSLNTLAYEAYINKKPADIYYIFAEKQLVRSKYVFQKEYIDKKEYMDNFDELLKYLMKKYGYSPEELYLWKGNEDSYDQLSNTDLAKAVGNDDLSIFYSWNNERTIISLGFYYADHRDSNVQLEIQYESKTAKVENLEEKQVLEDL